MKIGIIAATTLLQPERVFQTAQAARLTSGLRQQRCHCMSCVKKALSKRNSV